MYGYETASRGRRPLRMMQSPAIKGDGRTAQDIVRALLAEENAAARPAPEPARQIAPAEPSASVSPPRQDRIAPQHLARRVRIRGLLVRLAGGVVQPLLRALNRPDDLAEPIHPKMAVDPFDRLAAQLRAQEG